jgi:hypothetical protein
MGLIFRKENRQRVSEGWYMTLWTERFLILLLNVKVFIFVLGAVMAYPFLDADGSPPLPDRTSRMRWIIFDSRFEEQRMK